MHPTQGQLMSNSPKDPSDVSRSTYDFQSAALIKAVIAHITKNQSLMVDDVIF